jgi:hypothetical protein
MPPHLLGFPQEIRDNIYREVFKIWAGSSGKVFIAKYEGSRKALRLFVLKVQANNLGPDDTYGRNQSGHYELSILETCKQLYNEAHAYLWRNTTLKLWPGEKWVYMPYFRQVQHVQLDLDLADRSELQKTQDTLQVLGQWAEKGTLRTININIVVSDEDLRYVVRDGQVRRQAISESVEKYLMLLKYATGRPSRRNWSLRDVVRRVKIVSGFMQGCTSEARPSDRAKLLKDIHTAFGGELWHGGVLCWKDYELVADPSSIPINNDPRAAVLQALLSSHHSREKQASRASWIMTPQLQKPAKVQF